MDKNRRNLLKAGASAAVGGMLLGPQGVAGAQGSAASGQQVKSVPPLAAKIGMRLATCSLATGAAPTVVEELDDGKIIDLKAEAQRQNVNLGFDGGSMLALIASGNAGLEKVKAVADRAAQQKTGLHAAEHVQ